MLLWQLNLGAGAPAPDAGGDIGKFWDETDSDFLLERGDLAGGADLDAALINSIFTDRRADPDDELPAGAASRRGWWGDTLAIADGGDAIGSRLWLLSREKQTQATLNKAQGFAREALAWLVEDGVAASVDVTAEWVDRGVLGLDAKIVRPTGERIDRRFDFAWNQVATN